MLLKFIQTEEVSSREAQENQVVLYIIVVPWVYLDGTGQWSRSSRKSSRIIYNGRFLSLFGRDWAVVEKLKNGEGLADTVKAVTSVLRRLIMTRKIILNVLCYKNVENCWFLDHLFKDTLKPTIKRVAEKFVTILPGHWKLDRTLNIANKENHSLKILEY